MHDATKVLLGSVGSSERVVTCENADPADFPAGVAVRRASDGTLQLEDDSTAAFVGVSLGASLSDTTKTAVCRVGNRVPIRLEWDGVMASKKIGDITFTSKVKGTAGNAITITLADTLSDGSASVSVDGTDITIDIEGGVTTAEDIAAAVEADTDADALVSVVVDTGDEAVAQAAAAETALEGGTAATYSYVTKGAQVLVNDTTGEACPTGDNDVATSAIYLTGKLTGIDSDGSEVDVAIIDLSGGL